MIVRAFDGTKTCACGEIDLKILVGPCEFELSFVVVEIIFNLLTRATLDSFCRSHLIKPTSESQIHFNDKLMSVMAKEDISTLASLWCLSLTRNKWISLQVSLFQVCLCQLHTKVQDLTRGQAFKNRVDGRLISYETPI